MPPPEDDVSGDEVENGENDGEVQDPMNEGKYRLFSP